VRPDPVADLVFDHDIYLRPRPLCVAGPELIIALASRTTPNVRSSCSVSIREQTAAKSGIRASMAGDSSTPSTGWPSSASGRRSRPVPQPSSRTDAPAGTAAWTISGSRGHPGDYARASTRVTVHSSNSSSPGRARSRQAYGADWSPSPVRRSPLLRQLQSVNVGSAPCTAEARPVGSSQSSCLPRAVRSSMV
jgi:hypothetical protein